MAPKDANSFRATRDGLSAVFEDCYVGCASTKGYTCRVRILGDGLITVYKIRAADPQIINNYQIY